MGKILKGILIFVFALVFLIVSAAIIIPLVADLNDYKTEMEVAVHEQTGRNLKIEGELDLSVFPWLGVSTGKIILSNAAGFAGQPFVIIGEADIKVKLLPLFSKHIEVSTVVLKGLELHLEKNQQGMANWEDLGAQNTGDEQPAELTEKEVSKAKSAGVQAPEQEMATEEAAIDLTAIKIGGLVIQDSLVSWDDQQAGQHIVVKEFNFSSGAVVFNQPIALKMGFLLENADPAVTERLTLSTSLVIDEALQKIQLANFHLDSATKGESIPGGQIDTQLESEFSLDLQAQTLAVKNIQLATNLMQLTGELNASKLNTDLQYTGAIQIAPFSPKKLMQQLAIDVPETSDKQVLQQFAMGFDLQGSADSVVLESLKIILDDTNIKGSVSVRQFNQPAITFQLAVDNIDVDRYSAPKQKSSPAKTSPAVKRKAHATETDLLPMDTLRTLDINGDLKIARLKAAQLNMAGVSLNLQARQGILKTRQTIDQLYQGNYKGQITINAKGKMPVISLNEKIANVQLEPLLTDLQPNSKAKIKGLANIAAKLRTTGNTMPAIKSALGGTLNFSLDKGAVRGFNLQKIIDLGRLAAQGKKMRQSYADEQTLFTVIKGSATIKKGIINNPDFLAESSTIEVKGGGTANLVNEALDYRVVAKAKKGGKNIANRPVAIKVGGTFSEPNYVVDLTAINEMMTDEEKQKVNKFIDKREKEIDKALGEGTGKAVNKLLKGFFN
ncbi:AsmA protein [Bathymodiolus japonicus methanotrophic gill symbiont]|uniref:AsmA family protein n=1 Tax=Bathymodiolus japonicus methanotrophic gill symbiont TaxID=113269 RepID=UPI001B7456FB|nr:AsmA family protein [Bathymodiolus japonicus methanotrophic gill symbiont]GFO72182.1 AsmA protein [Bathymodiolus japonicus methanotrophic gill symbiont]